MKFKCRHCNLPSVRQYHTECFEEIYRHQKLISAQLKKQKNEAREKRASRQAGLDNTVAKARATPRRVHGPWSSSEDVERKWSEAFAKSANPEARFEDVILRRRAHGSRSTGEGGVQGVSRCTSIVVNLQIEKK